MIEHTNIPMSHLKLDVQKRKKAKDKKHNKKTASWTEAADVINTINTGLNSYQSLINNIKSLPNIYPSDIKITMMADLETMENDISIYRAKIMELTQPFIDRATDTIPRDDIPNYLVVHETLVGIGEDILNVINPISVKCYATFLQYVELIETNEANQTGTINE